MAFDQRQCGLEKFGSKSQLESIQKNRQKIKTIPNFPNQTWRKIKQ